MNESDSSPAQAKKSLLRRFLPLILLGLGFTLFFALGLQHEVSLAALKAHRGALQAAVAAHPVLAALIFTGLYALAVAFSLPVATAMTLAGGFLFGALEGGALVVAGATAGATAVFLAARSAFADLFERRVGGRIRAMEEGFRKNAFSYLLVLRLIPVFPFFLVNLAAGLLGVRPSTYISATLIGIVPGTFVYAGLGNGLGRIFDSGGMPDLGLVFKPYVLIPLIGLALLSLLPILWRSMSARRKR